MIIKNILFHIVLNGGGFKSAEEIVEHISQGSDELKAEIVSNIIDSSGIAQSVMKQSKTCKETVIMNVEETASLISGVRSSDLLWAQARRAFHKTLGFSPICNSKCKKGK